MDRFLTRTRAQGQQLALNIDDSQITVEEPPEIAGPDADRGAGGVKLPPLLQPDAVENPLPFTGMKARKGAHLVGGCQGDYIDVPNDPYLSKLLRKQGDGKVLFSDKVLSFTSIGKIKSRILLITDIAIYLIDPASAVLKRRIALATIEKLLMSELNDSFFAIIVPSEYDCLMSSTRKTEIANVLLEAMEHTSQHELKVFRLNSFEYNAAADMVKEVEFMEVDGSIRTQFRRKEK